MNEVWLKEAQTNLERVVANILQLPQRDASTFADRVTGAVTVKVGGAATATGILGLIGSFGTASTGTAIASLSGAAYTTASLYWMGSLVGGGVWAGGLLTGGLGIVAAVIAMKLFVSKPRPFDTLSEEEQRLVNASLGLAKTLGEQIELGKAVGKGDAEFVRDKAWLPLMESFRSYRTSLNAARALGTKNFFGFHMRIHEFDRLTKDLERWIANAP